jgi:hypothetical protein
MKQVPALKRRAIFGRLSGTLRVLIYFLNCYFVP